MELRRYWQVLADRWPVVGATFLVALIVAAFSVFLAPQPSSQYQAEVLISVKPAPLPASQTMYYSDDYYSYVASEYINDDLIDIIQGDNFHQAVRDDLKGTPGGVPDGDIQAKKAHRVLEITTSSSTAAGAVAMAKAVSDLLTAPDAQAKYFASLTNRPQAVAIADAPRLIAQPAGKNPYFNLAARALVGLAVGVGLAFLLEYLDDTVRSAEIDTLLGLPVLAEVPGRGLPRSGKAKSAGRPEMETVSNLTL
ncbi:MAG TPA: hypothetical protein VFZ25_07170 [Chloroflexota bacterium]|nr:hypothetical protein [Chloroflexota bacterium]